MQEVRGAGVVGEQTGAGSGERFEYTAAHPATPFGLMVGSYRETHEAVTALGRVPAFSLDARIRRSAQMTATRSQGPTRISVNPRENTMSQAVAPSWVSAQPLSGNRSMSGGRREKRAEEEVRTLIRLGRGRSGARGLLGNPCALVRAYRNIQRLR